MVSSSSACYFPAIFPQGTALMCISPVSKTCLLTIWIDQLRMCRTNDYKGIWTASSPVPHFSYAEADFQTGNTASQIQNWDLRQSSVKSNILPTAQHTWLYDWPKNNKHI